MSMSAFCWASARQPDGTVFQISKFQGCKDYMHDAVHNHHHNGASGLSNSSHCYKPDFKPNMDINRLRMLMCTNTNTTTVEQVYTGKRIVNLLERRMGWSLSSIRRVEHPVEKQCFLLIGPGQWMAASFIISMYTLIMRASSLNPASFPSNWREAEQKLGEWTKNSGGDGTILSDCYKKMLPFLMARHQMLKDMTMEDLWPPDAAFFNFHNPAGFKSLCTGQSFSTKIKDRFRELNI